MDCLLVCVCVCVRVCVCVLCVCVCVCVQLISLLVSVYANCGYKGIMEETLHVCKCFERTC